MATPTTSAGQANGPPWRRWAPLGVLLVLLATFWVAGGFGVLSVDSLIGFYGTATAAVSAHPVTASALFALAYGGVVALSLPAASLMTLTGGVLFGWLWGGALSVLGATVGASLLFLAVRHAAADWARARVGSVMARAADGFRQDGFGYLLGLRLIPAFPFWMVTLVAALADLRFASFALATLIGIAPATFVYAWIGQGLSATVAGQAAAGCAQPGGPPCRLDLSALASPGLLAGLAALGLLALAPVIWRRWRAGRR